LLTPLVVDAGAAARSVRRSALRALLRPPQTKNEGKRRRKPTAPALDNSELKEGKKEGGFETIKQGRAANRRSAEVLFRMSQNPNDQLLKASNQLRHCGTRLILRDFNSPEKRPATNSGLNLAGGWYCKSRLCPTCARKKAKIRQHNALKFIELEQKTLQGYHAYQVVLTLKHNTAEGVRTDFYLALLLNLWKKLRGRDHNRAQRAWWDSKVQGTIWSVEIIKAKHDSTGHIHLHVLLFSKYSNLTRKAEPGKRTKPKKSVFEQQIQACWLGLTGDSPQVHVEKAYYTELVERPVWDGKRLEALVKAKTVAAGLLALAEEELVKVEAVAQSASTPPTEALTKAAKGVHVANECYVNAATAVRGAQHLDQVGSAQHFEKVYYDPKKHDVSVLERVMTEAMKYTMKANAQELEGLGAEFVTSMLTERRRYFGRTGIFSAKNKKTPFKRLDVLNAKYRDPAEQAKRREDELTEPISGVQVPAVETRLAVTLVSNVRWAKKEPDFDHRYRERGEEVPPDREYYTLKQNKPAWVQYFADNDEDRQEMHKHLARGVGRGYSPKADVFEDEDQRKDWNFHLLGCWRG
jgi:hypothetical protein